MTRRASSSTINPTDHTLTRVIGSSLCALVVLAFIAFLIGGRA
jgi:hypothetical protein